VPATLDELLTTRTAGDEETSLLSVLKSAGFPVTDWEAGGAGQTLVKAIANALADHGKNVAAVTAGGFVALAKALPDPTWLDLIAEQFYALSRSRATYTKQLLRVSCEAGLGPQTVNAGFTVAARVTGNRYVYNGAPVVVPDASFVDIEVQAESPGSAFVDPAGMITEMITPLPGLSVENRQTSFGGLVGATARKNSANQGSGAVTPGGPVPTKIRFYTIRVTASGAAGSSGAIAVDIEENGVKTTTFLTPIPALYVVTDDNSFTLTLDNGVGAGFIVGDRHTFETPGSPMLANGVDDESQESLASRCIGRWPSLGLNIVSEKYVAWIRQSSLDNAFGIEKISTRPSNTVAGQTNIYVATAAGAPAGAVLTVLQTYVDARDGITDTASVLSAVNLNILLGGSVTVRAADLLAVQAAADEAWRLYIAGLPIGGDRSTGFPGVARLAELVQALMDAGAIDHSGLTLNGAGVNVSYPADDRVAVIPAGNLPSEALTWIGVA
jgi:hypothetical protein